ncbi:MAG: hypothetical protein AB1793_01985 [Candidatus Thermoplasmatota archaeon]
MAKKNPPASTGSLEKSKELLVLAYFLFTGNKPASADRVVEYWSPEGTGVKEEVLPEGVGPDERSLSRAGAAKICKRLVSEGLLFKRERLGYRNKMVNEYYLPSGSEFLMVGERIMKTYPMLALRSDYGKEWLRTSAIPRLCRTLRIDLKPWLGDIEWVAGRSPTVFTMMTDDTIKHGSAARLESEKERISAFLEFLICAVKVDMMSGAKGLLLDGETSREVTDRLRDTIKGFT